MVVAILERHEWLYVVVALVVVVLWVCDVVPDAIGYIVVGAGLGLVLTGAQTRRRRQINREGARAEFKRLSKVTAEMTDRLIKAQAQWETNGGDPATRYLALVMVQMMLFNSATTLQHLLNMEGTPVDGQALQDVLDARSQPETEGKTTSA